jgi:hypothetical protein
MRQATLRAVLVTLLVVVAGLASADPRRIVVAVPCEQLSADQCASFTAMADQFVPALLASPVKHRDAPLPGAACPTSDFAAFERCYDAGLSSLTQPVGSHLGLKDNEPALLVLLFDPRTPEGTIFGSYILVPAGENPSMSSFSLRPEEIMTGGVRRSVYVVSGGMLADEAFRLGLATRRNRSSAFTTAPGAATHGDLAIERRAN